MPSNSKADRSSFPPISSRKNEEPAQNSDGIYDASESREDHQDTCDSVLKLPTIERTKSRSISSISSPTSTLGSRQFTRDKPSRRSLCRSPSCPSNIGLSRQESRNCRLDNGVYDHFPQPEENEDDLKLPDIFRNTSPKLSPRQSSIGTKWKSDKENSYLYSLRKTESFHDSPTEKQDQPQTHALLLPLRSVDTVSRAKNKKKKKLHKSKSELSIQDRENTLAGGRWSSYENEQNQLNGSKECLMEGTLTDRQVEIMSARKMKKWMKTHPQKEGQVKA